MNPFEFVIAIMVIVMVASVIKHRQKLAAESEPAAEPHEQARLRDEVRQLRERIQVLERVITDGRQSLDLTQEIERLRDR